MAGPAQGESRESPRVHKSTYPLFGDGHPGRCAGHSRRDATSGLLDARPSSTNPFPNYFDQPAQAIQTMKEKQKPHEKSIPQNLTPGEPGGDDLTAAQQEMSKLLAAGDAAINAALSNDSAAFLNST